MEQPVIYWTPSIAPSGMEFYTGNKIPQWTGDLFVGALAGQHLRRLEVDGKRVVAQEVLLDGTVGRVRDVATGPDGYLYLITDASSGTLYRLELRSREGLSLSYADPADGALGAKPVADPRVQPHEIAGAHRALIGAQRHVRLTVDDVPQLRLLVLVRRERVFRCGLSDDEVFRVHRESIQREYRAAPRALVGPALDDHACSVSPQPYACRLSKYRCSASAVTKPRATATSPNCRPCPCFCAWRTCCTCSCVIAPMRTSPSPILSAMLFARDHSTWRAMVDREAGRRKRSGRRVRQNELTVEVGSYRAFEQDIRKLLTDWRT